MIRTLFIMGPSDIEEKNRTTSVPAEGGGKIMTAELTGVLPILSYVMGDRLLSANSEALLIGVNQVRLPHNPHVNIFNLMGDPDACSETLRTIQVIANKVRPQRLFNQPSDVYKTSRARLPRTLADIPGCIVPRVEAVDPGNFGELQSACDQFGSWPMVVRARGYHGGKRMIMLTDPGHLDACRDLPWLYNGIVLAEFIDYRNAEGLYQKNRVIVIDGVAYPRHAIFSDQWLIHAGSRVDLMDKDIALCHQEERFLATGLEPYTRVFQQIHQRIGLDVFGMDFGVVDDEIVIFEANACMNFLDRRFGDDRYHYLNGHVKLLQRAIRKMLLKS